MRDGSISAFQGMLLSDETLRARCESSGSLDQEKLKIEVAVLLNIDKKILNWDENEDFDVCSFYQEFFFNLRS